MNGTSHSADVVMNGVSNGAAPAASKAPFDDSYYYDSYAHFGIHEEMLKDRVRTNAYRRAIVENKHLFQDKIVMDVGCGTGILSMFAVDAGAKHVYAIEASGIARQARGIIEENGMSDRITVIQQKIEDVTELSNGVQQVDIIISEWMGYFLLYESMMDSVLLARDRWLRKDGQGILMPDRATLYLCGIEDTEYRAQKLGFWNNVYGFSMKTIQRQVLNEPIVDVCESKQIATSSAPIIDINLYTVTAEQLDFNAKFSLTMHRADTIHALTGYFTTTFEKTHTKVMISTSPRHEYQHWKQTHFYLPQPYQLKHSQKIQGEISVKRSTTNKRELDITLTTSTDVHRQPIKTDFKLK